MSKYPQHISCIINKISDIIDFLHEILLLFTLKIGIDGKIIQYLKFLKGRDSISFLLDSTDMFYVVYT